VLVDIGVVPEGGRTRDGIDVARDVADSQVEICALIGPRQDANVDVADLGIDDRDREPTPCVGGALAQYRAAVRVENLDVGVPDRKQGFDTGEPGGIELAVAIENGSGGRPVGGHGWNEKHGEQQPDPGRPECPCRALPPFVAQLPYSGSILAGNSAAPCRMVGAVGVPTVHPTFSSNS